MMVRATWRHTAVALKSTSTVDEHDTNALRNEIANYAVMKFHDNVVTIYGICEDAPDGRPRIVMQFCLYGSVLHNVQSLATVRVPVYQ